MCPACAVEADAVQQAVEEAGAPAFVLDGMRTQLAYRHGGIAGLHVCPHVT